MNAAMAHAFVRVSAKQQAVADETRQMDYATLRRKAKYGHRAYLYWTNRDGAFQWAPYGRTGIKAAILAGGAKGKFFWYDSDGISNIARSLSYMLHLWRCAG